MNSNRIVQVSDPVNLQDVATKNYVDINSSGGLPSNSSLSSINTNNPSTGLPIDMSAAS